jgi:hypothetical protein
VTESVTLICTIGENWRVSRIADRPGWGAPRWLIERKVDSDWRGEATFRVAASLREYLQYNCGPIDPEAAAILAPLPARCDRDPQFPPPPRYQTKRPRKPREPAVVAGSNRAALASQFTSWRDAQAASRPVVRSQPETAPTPPPAENNAQAARAASALQQAEAKP